MRPTFILAILLATQLAAADPEAFEQPWGKFFGIERKAGVYRQFDTESHFQSNHDFTHLTFDTGNNKVLANLGVQGQLKSLTIYRDSYRAASHPQGWSGVWTAKDSSSFGPYSFTLAVDGVANGAPIDLATADWDFRTGLIDNILPTTILQGPGGRFTAQIVTFAPTTADGTGRLRGVVYGLRVQNRSDQRLTGTVGMPKLWGGKQNQRGSLSWAMFDPYEFEIGLADSPKYRRDVAFDLKPGESAWVPAILYMPGEPTIAEINAGGSLAWLADTLRYQRRLLGRLKIASDPWLAEFRERQILESLLSIAMSGSGKIAGSNWGSYPATRQIWIKDMYYSSLPLLGLDPVLAKGLVQWFDEFAVRHPGEIVEGGISHSLSLTVAAVLMGSQYYGHTADRAFFANSPGLRKSWADLLERVAGSRRSPSTWLFPSRFISDGALQGDFHTGSNITAWRAFTGWSRLLRDVYRDVGGAREWADRAEKVRASILATDTFDGPFGRQFAESAFADHHPMPLISDGEESDTTLMPYYRFLDRDDPRYRNTMRFAVSSHNLIYQPLSHSISWSSAPVSPLSERVPSTAPGYLKGLAAADPAAEMEIRRVTDADGSVWWWSYGSSPKGLEYGRVQRGVPGKSGWFAGAYSVLFQSNMLGISYDAPSHLLRVNPTAGLSDFEWLNAPLGTGRFDVSSSGGKITVRNLNKVPVDALRIDGPVTRIPPGMMLEIR